MIKENEVLIRVGAYKKGMDPELDKALARKEKIRAFLTQNFDEQFSDDEILKGFMEVLHD
jgi:flagellum-specific ATP synthase